MALVHMKAGWNATACRSDARSGFRGGYASTGDPKQVTCGECLNNMKEPVLTQEERHRAAVENAKEYVRHELEVKMRWCLTSDGLGANRRRPGTAWAEAVQAELVSALASLEFQFPGSTIAEVAGQLQEHARFYQDRIGEWTVVTWDGARVERSVLDESGEVIRRE